jgi:type I restriction enzyme M protein
MLPYDTQHLLHPGPAGTLADAAADLRRRLCADGAADGEDDDFSGPERQWAALIEWAGAAGKILPLDFPPPDREGGREHDVTLDDASGRWIKYTKPSSSGYTVSWNEAGEPYMHNATPLEYLQRLLWQNEVLGDDRHMFGDIYEKLLKDLQSAGNAGEFYTPRAVTQFIVEQVNPRLGESVLDPACGTGGFLVCAIEHLRKQAKDENDERSIQECFAGIEKKHLPHVLCMTNLMLHGIDVPSNVRHDNTLSRPLRDWGPKERVDCIVTNPPFGGMEEDGIEANYPADFRTRETADLFLVLIMKLLKPGGRAGLVLPDGTLFGEGVKTRIKEALLTECNLHTIVRLPNGVFNPYTGIRTNLLFFTKGTPTKEVWYYEHPYPPGAKSYNKTKPIRIEEFDPIKAWWGSEADGFKARVENDRAWRVSIDQIKAGNFNLDLKNPHSTEEGPGDVDHLLPEYEKLLQEIAETRGQLKTQLMEALTR